MDQCQDHNAAYFSALAGRQWSCDTDEFIDGYFRAGYFGRLIISRNTNTTVNPNSIPDIVGIHGVGVALGGVGPFSFTAESGLYRLDADFLVTAKVKVGGFGDIDSVASRGFVVGLGPAQGSNPFPSFVVGSDVKTWQVLYSPDNGATVRTADSGIAANNDTWYRLQISRVQGAVRWFINGQLARFRDIDGSTVEGSYYPIALQGARKNLEMARTPNGPNVPVYVDCFHLLAQRIS
jgi:hypothetical protein